MQVQGCGPKRPQLFNWVTVLLLIAWLLIVAVIAGFTNVPEATRTDRDSFIEAKLLGVSPLRN